MKSLLSNDMWQWVRHCFASCFNHMNSEETIRAVTGRQQVWSKWLAILFTEKLKAMLFSHLTYMFPFQNLKNKGLVRHSAPPSFLLPLLKGCRSPYLAVLCSSLPWIFQKNSNDSNDFSCTLRSRNTEEMHNLLHTESSSPSQEIDVA